MKYLLQAFIRVARSKLHLQMKIERCTEENHLTAYDIEFDLSISIYRILRVFFLLLCPKMSLHSIHSSLRAIPAFCIGFFSSSYIRCDFQLYIVLLAGVYPCCNYQLASIWCLYTWHTFYLASFPSHFCHSVDTLFIPFRSDLFYCSYSLRFQSWRFAPFVWLIYVFKIINKRYDQQMIFFLFFADSSSSSSLLTFGWFQKWVLVEKIKKIM